MLNLVIYKERPILVERTHKLQLLSNDPQEIELEYQSDKFTLQKGETVKLEDNITLTYLRNYKKNGASIGFDAPPNTAIQRCTGYDKRGRPIWYSRN